MSHYTALISANSQEDLAAKMLPYHEYGLGMDVGEGEKQFLVCDEKHGLHNPNARWDWYGRECGLLKLKPQKTEGIRVFKKLMEWFRHRLLKLKPQRVESCNPNDYGPSGIDNALVKQVDWNGILQDQFDATALTDAFIDLEGNWKDRRMINQSGCSSDEDGSYDEAFWQFVRSLPDWQRVYTVYYHS